MSDKDRLILQEAGEGSASKRIKSNSKLKLPWYFASGFLLLWFLLYFAVVIPLFYRLPTSLTIEDDNKGEFIGDRAYDVLNNLVNIGTRVAGSDANELEAVNFLLNEISKIQKDLLEDYFTLEVDVHKTSGSHIYHSLLEMYQGVQNVVVKLSPRNSSSESYLLVNSHYDTVATSPGAGDDGFMVATMMEVLRVMATTPQTLEHPVVFLFNGDEEMGMQASHGFITQHKWAPNCKAVVNLDSAGSGGREILFQTGPSHAWLANYYKKSAKHPFATTMAEEFFQMGLIPSDTDYRILTQYGQIPGLDLGQAINGFIYHTKYDRIDVIPRGSIQNTGDNVLSLVRALANAPELLNIQAHEGGNSVYYDILGLTFITYSEEMGQILNYGAAGITLILVFISAWRMSAVSQLLSNQVWRRLIILVILQSIGFVLALALPLVVAYILDSFGLSLTYFSTLSLVIGLYVCPALIGLCLPITVYYHTQDNSKLPFTYHVQLALHSWAILLSLLAIVATAYGLRSIYIVTILIIFYAVSLVLSLLSTSHDRGYSWSGLVIVSQVIPFLYSSYLFYTFIVVLTPMNGRSGSASNPDMTVAALAAAGAIFSFGFLLPLTNVFRRSGTVLLTLLVITSVTIYLACGTEMGFPYRPRTNSARALYQHVRRTFYDYDGSVISDESGYLFNLQDRRETSAFPGVNFSGAISQSENCKNHMMCAAPLFDERWVENRLQGIWLPREEPVVPKIPTTLELLSKTVLADKRTIRFSFRLTGPPYLSLFIQTYEDDFVTVSDWSFSKTYLEQKPASPLAYHIYITYGRSEPLEFYLDITKPNGKFDVPLFQLGISASNIGDKGDEHSVKFASTFPSYAIVVDWPSQYTRYIF
ncbi:endoplasmic reticulum metallopeptidase 1 [Drosophila mojavensis]|uniref:endoplasmic reticulum metallopeptidase 1 n=1 Tax=Drosophila mojavensis TaxID=7230 RepID=UPI00017C9D6C|nr:endoplasmic reticulum metallopeptidase 1 [Drosophila mojavensis]